MSDMYIRKREIEIEFAKCICGDFQIEDMIRAYDKGSMKLEENKLLKKENIEAKRIIKKSIALYSTYEC